MSPATAYKIGVNVPPGTEQEMMDSIDEVMSPLYPGYERCFCWWIVRSTWKPAEGSHPYIGEVGRIEIADEVRIEFAVREEDLEAVVSRIAEVHPYEEPAIDILPMIPWKSVAIGPSCSRSCRRCRRTSACGGSSGSASSDPFPPDRSSPSRRTGPAPRRHRRSWPPRPRGYR